VPAIAPVDPVLAARDRVEAIASAAAIYPVAAAEAGMPSEEVPGGSADPATVAAAVVAPPVSPVAAVVEEASVAAAAVAADGADRRPGSQKRRIEEHRHETDNSQ
jgi:hypothetical protein